MYVYMQIGYVGENDSVWKLVDLVDFRNSAFSQKYIGVRGDKCGIVELVTLTKK